MPRFSGRAHDGSMASQSACHRNWPSWGADANGDGGEFSGAKEAQTGACRRLDSGAELSSSVSRRPIQCRRDVCALYAGDVEDHADGAYDRAVSAVKICLPSEWKTTEKVDGVHARTTMAARGEGPRVRVVSRDASGDAYLVELWVDAAGR